VAAECAFTDVTYRRVTVFTVRNTAFSIIYGPRTNLSVVINRLGTNWAVVNKLLLIFFNEGNRVMIRSVVCAALLLLIVVFPSTGQGDSLVLTGVVTDTIFRGTDTLTLEVLENGELYPVFYQRPFEIPLPSDDSWNICVRDTSTEQCYEISRNQGDSITRDTIANDMSIQVFTSFIDSVPGILSETVDTVSQESVDSIPVRQDEVDLLTRLRPVVIQIRKRPRRSLGQSTVSSKAISRQPGLAEADVIKAIQALPGVVASSDFSSKIYVRGGGADQNLFLFDNGVVYSPVHFFGLFSTFLVDGIEKVDFYKGGFSPEFGNRLSSVVDITSRKGGRDDTDSLKLAGALQITTFASTASLEGSKNETRLNISGRVTYLKEVLTALKEVGVTDFDVDYRFFDLQGNLFQGIGDDMGVKLSFYTGRDELVLTPLKTDWGNSVVPLNFYWNMSDDLRLDISGAWSRFDQKFGIEKIQTFTNDIQSFDIKAAGTYFGIENHRLHLGLDVQFFKTSFGNIAEFADLSQTAENTFNLYSLFAEDKINWKKFEFAPGLRVNYMDAIEEFSLEPRFSARYNVTDMNRFDFHTGYYKQFINSVIFGDFEPINEFYYPANIEETQTVPPSSSLLFSVGYSHDQIFGQFDVIGEAYYKTLDGLIVFAPDEKPDSIRNNTEVSLGDLFIPGEGYSLGFELSLRKPEGKITGGVSYGFGYSVLKEGDIVARADWDLPHSLKVDAGITWRDPNGLGIWRSKRNFLRSSIQFKSTSGAPYSEITGYMPTHYIDQGDGDLPGGPTPALSENIATPLGGKNNSRYPFYARLDIKVIDWGREGRWEFNWTLINVLDRENVFFYNYDNAEQPPERTTIAQFPALPILLSFKRYF